MTDRPQGRPEDRRARADAILGDALDLPASARAEFVARACAGDDAFQAELMRLLRSAEEPDSFLTPGGALAGPLAEDMAARRPEAGRFDPGARLGPFRIVREIGRGGMGVVYLAERAEGGFRQQVALKVVPPGVDSEAILRRFERERQIVAALNHPAIARLVDGGLTGDGRPYFAMEYVDGRPIDRHCDGLGLTVEERLEIFRTVAAAVQHAHVNLLVHRDIKPGNILISVDGQVKLLDFGIAKPIGSGGPAGEDPLTRATACLMTPEYASPEQVRGEPVSTASDVYQLGLLLYELLTGRRAQRFRGEGLVEAERIVCRDDPPRPSAVVFAGAATTPDEEAAAAARRTTPAGLARRLRGDLDNIVMMAIRKEPERRFHSPAEMAEDIERSSQSLPIRAGRGTQAYRAGKFIRRHRTAVAAAAAFALLLAGYAVTVTLQAAQIARERDRVRMEAGKSREVRDFLVGLFQGNDPDESRGAEITARQLLERGAERIDSELENQPEVRAEMLSTLGDIYRQLGQYDRGRDLQERALATLRARPGADPLQLSETLLRMGRVLRKEGRFADAETVVREADAIVARALGPDDLKRAETLSELGVVLYGKADYDAAKPLFERSLAISRSQPGGDPGGQAEALNNLGLIHGSKEDWPQAESYYRRALDLHRRTYGADHPRVAENLFNIGRMRQMQGDFAGAEPFFSEGLEIQRRALGEDHPDVGIYCLLLANTIHKKGDPAASEPLFLKARAIFEAKLPADHPRIADLRLALGRAYTDLRRLSEAEPLLREALRLRSARYGPEARQASEARLSLGACLGLLGRHGEAEAELEHAYHAVHEKNLRLEREVLVRLVELYEARGRMADATRHRALLGELPAPAAPAAAPPAR